MKTIFLFILIFFSKNIFCQSVLKIGGETSFAGETFFKTFNQGGIGLTCNYNYTLAKNDELYMHVAWQRFYDYRIDPLNKTVDVTPIRAGYAKKIFHSQLGIFADIGIATTFFPSRKFTDLSASAGISYRFTLINKNYIQSSLLYTYSRYSEYNKNDYFSWYSLRLEYGFVLSKKAKK